MSYRKDFIRAEESLERYRGWLNDKTAELEAALEGVMDVFDLRERYPDQQIKAKRPLPNYGTGPRAYEEFTYTVPGRTKFHEDLKAAANATRGSDALGRILGPIVPTTKENS